MRSPVAFREITIHAIMIKKIVISPSNKAAISFFEEIANRKTAIKKKLEDKAAARAKAHNNNNAHNPKH